MRVGPLAPLVGALVAFVCLPSALARPVDELSGNPFFSRANPDFPNPKVDPFYQAPTTLSASQNGEVLRRRSVPTNVQSVFLDSSYQLYYCTEDTHGDPTGTVATLFVPKTPSKTPKLLSLQWYEDSVSLDCSPSFALVQNSGSTNAIVGFLDIGIITQYALAKGWYVVHSDHEGPKLSFIAGHNSGRAVLDSIRAAINDQKLPADTKVAMTGYSGGAHATVWAETLHESYAPEINIVGSCHGGTPVDPKGTLELINKGPFAGFAFAGLLGLMSQYPELDAYVRSILTDAGREKLSRFTATGFYLPSVVTGALFENIFSYTNVSNPLADPVVIKVLKTESLLDGYASETVPVPKHPRLIFHGAVDEIVTYADNKEYVRDQCKHGANIQFNMLLAEHITGELFGLPGTINFLTQALEGTIPEVKCGTILPDFKLGLYDPKFDELMGKDLANQARAFKGTKSPFGRNY